MKTINPALEKYVAQMLELQKELFKNEKMPFSTRWLEVNNGGLGWQCLPGPGQRAESGR